MPDYLDDIFEEYEEPDIEDLIYAFKKHKERKIQESYFKHVNYDAFEDFDNFM